MSPFAKILDHYRITSFSQADKGKRFERLMRAYLLTDPVYQDKFKHIWLWNEFPGRKDSGSGQDTGIDLVALTHTGDYWAIQCKCYAEDATIDKPAVDSFLATSGKTFKNEELQTVKFAHRMWISTTNKWGPNATDAIKAQDPPVQRVNLTDLEAAAVDWEKLEKDVHGKSARAPKKEIYSHVWEVRDIVHEYYKTAERGKLIMACGTGKTLTSLKIAEQETGGKGTVLFLVPSIALLGQTLREWSNEAEEPIHPICICSDPEVSRTRKKNDDNDSFSVIDLAFPASTKTSEIVKQFKTVKKNGLTVVFSTYQSIDVISRAQKELLKQGFPQFDLIICDEAHRTTGVSLAGQDESAFVKVHNNDYLKAKKRLYMTATPRLYNADAKTKAAQNDAVLCSMDDEKLYGAEIHRIGFGEAVERKLLTDYKVLVLTLSEDNVPPAVQNALSGQDQEISIDDLTKLIGCINGLSKQILGDEGLLKASDPEPMRRAVAFCQRISDSQAISQTFNDSAEIYRDAMPEEKRNHIVSVAAQHVDGTMGAPQRDAKLSWLKADAGEGKCRILTNVRCLSEGVDVPSLDAVLFLSARNSQVDVVQSVGRVMRRAPGKKYGYIIIPVVVPSDVEPEQALSDNERYKVVWTVLNALRAHDDRFNAIVNKIELNKKKPEQILVGKPDTFFDENGNAIKADDTGSSGNELSKQFALQFEQLQGIVFARMVQKVGDRRYWEQWARDVAEIAQRQIERINYLLRINVHHAKTFKEFLEGLQQNINPSVSRDEAVEMLAQHMITRPVFEALFEGDSFVQHNAISQSMQAMLSLLEKHSLGDDSEKLQKFYESVKARAQGIDNAQGRQAIIIELYDTFFRTAFPKMAERLGIVYTPVEVVDFIIHSVNDVLQQEFGRKLTDENVHILDPFTGTGTFMTRLLQSGLIEDKDLKRKYLHELHANELVLLAYYIAAVNIENVFRDRAAAADIANAEALPFDGILLTDTFQLSEEDSQKVFLNDLFEKNTERVKRQKKTPIRVIMSNPPYSVGQKSANDNAQNQKYEALDERIAETYASNTKATNKNSLYDSYIKAFRWSADRLDPKNGGVIAFVSNGAWLDGNAQDGLRKCMEKEFSSIWVFNLRGNARTSGELRRKEAGNVFNAGSRTPIAITLLVDNPANKNEKATIHYHDIGDYLNREEKLRIIRQFGSVGNEKMPWQTLSPSAEGDWISQRNDAFATFFAFGDKDNKKNKQTFFVPLYSNGVKTQRDSWCYNSSLPKLKQNIDTTLNFYNSQVAELKRLPQDKKKTVATVVKYDSQQISWTSALLGDAAQEKEHTNKTGIFCDAYYRPFFKQKLYFSRVLNERVYQMPKLFPSAEHDNLVICVSAPGGKNELNPLIANCIPDLHFNGDTQCFPLHYYEEQDKANRNIFDEDGQKLFVKRDGITDWIHSEAKERYGNKVTKEDLFYYIYGLLHSPEYRTTFANDLKKSLPRLPLLENVPDFWAFSKAGRELAELHLNYETVPPYPGVTVTGDAKKNFTVEKMRFPAKGQKETILYNEAITITDIPEKAYEYVVNGKSAIEWVMERYQITTHKESGIRNDPNDWAKEVGNPRYILDLVLSVINVSVQTVDIVAQLPKVNFEKL